MSYEELRGGKGSEVRQGCSIFDVRIGLALEQHHPCLFEDSIAQVIGRIGQNRIYTPYMAIYFVICLPKILCMQSTLYIYGSGQA